MYLPMIKKVQQIMKNDSPQPLEKHLLELRKTVMVIAAAIAVFGCIAYVFSDRIISEIMDIDSGSKFIYTAPQSLMVVKLNISVVLGIAASIPVSALSIWHFISPALNSRENRCFIAAAVVGTVLFAAGAVFAYKIIFPFMIGFFTNMQIDGISAYISISEYVSFLLTVLIIFGLMFELPVVMCILTALGITEPSMYRAARKYAAVCIFVLSAIVTPPDVMSMLITAVPMLAVFEAGIWVSYLAGKKQDKHDKI